MTGRGHHMVARPMMGHGMPSQLHHAIMQPGRPAGMSMQSGMYQPTSSFLMGSGFDDCEMDGSSMAESARQSLGGGFSNARGSAQSDDSSDDRKGGEDGKQSECCTSWLNHVSGSFHLSCRNSPGTCSKGFQTPRL